MAGGELNLHPIAVFEDRYGGGYSRGAWIAVAVADVPIENTGMSRIAWAMEDGPSADDVTCSIFWSEPPTWIASGATADAAVAKLHENPRVLEDDWVPRLAEKHPLR